MRRLTVIASLVFPLGALFALLVTVFLATFPWENVEPGEGDLTSALVVATVGIAPAALIPVAIWRRAIGAAVALFIVGAATYVWWALLIARHPVT